MDIHVVKKYIYCVNTMIKAPVIRLSIEEHDGDQRLFADFPYDKELIKVVKEIPGTRWSHTHRQWHFNLNMQVTELLRQKMAGSARVDLSLLKTEWVRLKEKVEKFTNIHEETVKVIDYFKLWREQKRYAPQTVKSYLSQIIQFLTYYQPRSFKELTVENVEEYNHKIIIKKGLSVSLQQGMIRAIKLFYLQAGNTKMDLQKLQRPFIVG